MPSSFDDLYESLYGQRLTKDGEAYERIVAAVNKLLSPDSEVLHDQRLEGTESKSKYQIDVLNKQSGDSSFGEAKDYTDGGRKVGRPDLQKLGGALPDLEVNSGVFYSATDYTKPARQYASVAEKLVGKPISLMHIRRSTEDDEEGRIKKIILNVTVRTADYESSSFGCVFTEEAKKRVIALEEADDPRFVGTGFDLDEFYTLSGEVAYSVRELTGKGFQNHSTDIAEACYVLRGLAIKIGDELFPVEGVQYRVVFRNSFQEIQISADGKAVVLIRDENGTVDKLISDLDLKRVRFDQTGETKIID